MAKRTALYIRCSSLDQVKRGFSIPDQLARLRAEAKNAGEVVVAEFIDQARSGASAAKREEFQKLLAAASRREFDRLRVESVDRGHRNDMERRQFEADMTILAIEVIYSGEPEKQAPQYRKLQRGIKGVLAEWESDETSQRTYKRHRYRAQQGKWRGGNIPYGILPDGQGWFKPDPESYAVLIWILGKRGEGLSYHSIARMLNERIVLEEGTEPQVPPTPGLLIYQRRPYLERQDPETGEVIHEPRRVPAGTWIAHTINEICRKAVDGVYAGVLRWGENANRFREDADGNAKRPVRVETGRPLVPESLLHRVQAVELAVQDGEADSISPFNSYVLASLRCGQCGEGIHGYTSTKYKGEKKYRYRKYRCAGRVNRPGSCQMPMINADVLEQVVLDVVLADLKERSQEALLAEINEAVGRRRTDLVKAVGLAEERLAELERRRSAALDALTFQFKNASERVRAALAEQADDAVADCDEAEEQIRKLRMGVDVLDEKARAIERTLTDPFLDPARWNKPEAHFALKRALKLLVHAMTLRKEGPGAYYVEIEVYEIRESVSFESAWGSNPPAQFATTPTRFEDEGNHRAASALAADCRSQAHACQIPARFS
jgi:DNA invertase Pin-like site-specific DNA recombinase